MTIHTPKWAHTNCAIFNPNIAPILFSICGRELWALAQLQAAGATGCTAASAVATHLPAYVCKLPNRGVQIETIREANGGDFPGLHARYVLHSKVYIGAMPEDVK